MRRRCGGFAAGLASIRPAVGFLRSRAYPSTRVDDERAGGVYRKRAVLSATFRETWKTDEQTGRCAAVHGAVLDLGCRPNFGQFSDCTAVPSVPGRGTCLF